MKEVKEAKYRTVLMIPQEVRDGAWKIKKERHIAKLSDVYIMLLRTGLREVQQNDGKSKTDVNSVQSR